MLSLSVSHNSHQPLTEQIVVGVKGQIEDRHLRPGSKLPSIRSFAEAYGVSRFTVVEAYDRLVAMGYLQSRRGAGSTRPRRPRRIPRRPTPTSATSNLSG
jgi:DNA-binding GntR family transcriptional regulator